MTTDNDSLLEQAIIALDNDDAAGAQQYLARLLQQDPRNERAWLLMAEAQAEPERKIFCIEKVLALNPGNMMALQMREELRRAEEAPAPEPPAPLPAEPAAQPTQSAHLWPEPIAAFTPITTTSDPAFIRRELERAVDLIESGNRTAGMDIFEQVLAVDPNNESALLGMAAATHSLEERNQYLMRVLTINPKNKAARKLLAEAQQQSQLKPSKFARTDAIEAATDIKEYDWVEAWWLALTSPRVATYENLLADPNAGAMRAYTWIVVSAFFSFAIFGLTLIATVAALGPQVAGLIPAFDPNSQLAQFGIFLLCGLPLAAVGSVISVTLNVGLLYLSARILGGRGTFGAHLYTMSAFIAPATLLGSIVGAVIFVVILTSFFSGPPATLISPTTALLLNCLSLPFTVYFLVLQAVATKAAHQFGWGRTILSMLLPALVFGILAGCLALLVFQSFSSLPDLQELQRSLPPLP